MDHQNGGDELVRGLLAAGAKRGCGPRGLELNCELSSQGPAWWTMWDDVWDILTRLGRQSLLYTYR